MLRLLLLAGVACVTGEVLEVVRGRQARLHPEKHLRVRPPGAGERCWVRVVPPSADPASQRPGRLSPAEFPCDFREVVYTHLGAALPVEDRVALVVRYDTRDETVVVPATLYVRVAAARPGEALVERNLPLMVDAPGARSPSLSHHQLAFRVDRAAGQTCRLTVRGAPAHGRLEGPTQGDCDAVVNVPDVLFYHHDGRQGAPHVDHIPMVAEVSASDGTLVDKEYFQVTVEIAGLPPNQPPRVRASASLMLDVSQFVLTPLTALVLAAEDSETPADLLVFNITAQLSYGEGELISTDDPNGEPVGSFYQRDLRQLKIAYRPPASDSAGKRVFELQLQVLDSEGESSPPFLLLLVVHPKNTLAPVATRNAGLSLLEGHTRRLLASRHLELADEDNLEDVVVTVVAGLQHGTLLLMDTPALSFTPADLDAGLIAYRHGGGSVAAHDNIVFRLSDGDPEHDVLFLFPVTVFPVDDEAPKLVTNMAVDLREVEGADVRITTLVLCAIDVDSADEDIEYELLQPPALGTILLSSQPGSDEEVESTHWMQMDLEEGLLLYRYNGSHSHQSLVLEDTIRFTLRDAQTPPNHSPPQEFHVRIVPVDSSPPELSPGCPMRVDVPEKKISVVTASALCFSDAGPVPDATITIRVKGAPHFADDDDDDGDAGRLVLLDAPDQPLEVFTQAQVAHHKVAYRPPMLELGFDPKTVHVSLQATDEAGNTAVEQVLTLVLTPVDDLPPTVSDPGLDHVSPGNTVVIPLTALDARDQDTPSQRLQFRVTRAPTLGALLLSGRPLEAGALFGREDLVAGRLSYRHSGTDGGVEDEVRLELTDGVHRVPASLRIGVDMADTQPYSLQVMSVTPEVQVQEGHSAVLSSRMLHVSDSAGDTLMFLVEERPSRGQLQVSGQVADRFSLGEVETGLVSYLHTAGEIGRRPQFDKFVVSASDVTYANLIEVNVTVTPVDNAAPDVEVASEDILTVPEGGRGTITPAQLKVTDVDSDVEDLRCTVIAQPLFGYLVDATPSPGSELPRANVPISAFPYASVLRGALQYVQSIHRDVEPREDGFSLACSDIAATHAADAILIFPVAITPVNDEAPQMAPRQLVVMEGMEALLDASVLSAEDLDTPPDLLTFRVETAPRHGRLISHDTDIDIDIFTLDQLGDIVYEHDDSETIEDSFVLSLSDGVHSSKAEVSVMVISRDDEAPRLAINTGIEVDTGESAVITNRCLRATDLDSEDSSLSFVVRNTPTYGIVFVYHDSNNTKNLTVGSNFTQADIDHGYVKYTHRGTADDLRDVLKFDVSDGFNTLVGFDFYITIRTRDLAYPDVVNRGVELPEGGTVVLTTDILSTKDIDSEDSLLEFNIVRPPACGRLETSDEPSVPISRFTQLQLAGNKIRYVHTATNEDSSRGDSFEFEVSDGYNSAFRTFRITLTEVDNRKPVLYVKELVVPEGSERFVTPFELNIVDRDSAPKDLWVTVVQPPAHGLLLGNHTSLTSFFSMKDVLENAVSYRHDGSETLTDAFTVTVSDGTHDEFAVFPSPGVATRRPQTVSVRVVPVDDAPPRVLVNQGGGIGELREAGARGRLGLRLDNSVLKVADPDSPLQALRYVVTRPPVSGQLASLRAGLAELQNFSQGDVDAGDIMYVLREGSNATSDSFQFDVRDAGENMLPAQTFHLHWCWVSLLSEVHLVNETDGALAVTLRRRGYLGETSFVSVLVEGRTAVSGEDFRDGSVAQVQFSPGQSEATWLLHLQDDPHYEREEELLLRLRDPVLAVLEAPSWATVTIRDPEDESTVFFPAVEFEVEEDSGEVAVQVERTGDLSTELMVQCITENDSAVGTSPLDLKSYSDYISRPSGLQSTLKFNSGQQRAICHITLIDDSLMEPKEQFWVRLTNPIGGRLGQHSAQIIILSDLDDVPMLYFDESTYHVDESAGHLEVSVWRSGPDLSHPASVVVRSKHSYSTSAKVGYDYVGVGLTLNFAPGMDIMTFKVTILDDLGQPHLEGPETFLLVLGMPTNALLGHPEETTVVINDSLSDLPKMQFHQESYSILEEIGELRVPVWRSGDLSQASSVRCYTRQASATAGADFIERPDNNSSLVVFQAGEVRVDCILKIINDSKHEADEMLRLVLGSPSCSSFGTALLGFVNITTITILDHSDQPVIRFGKSRVIVQEPRDDDNVEVVHIPVVRQGDLSQMSAVRVHTKDGSATSGHDYIGKSAELVFHPNVSEIMFEVSILHDSEKETRETFTVHLKPDQMKIAKIKEHRLIAYIQEQSNMADVTFPAPPMVISLKDYDNAAFADEEPIGGYPVVCITPCNPKHPDFTKTGGLCMKEGINNSLTEFRWQVAAPRTKDGMIQEMKDLISAVFFARTRQIVLDSIYFSAGSQVRCAARAVNAEGDTGLELLSRRVTVSREEGLCLPQITGSFGAEPFTAKLKYTGSDDSTHPNLVRLTVMIPHRDGMLPALSTRPLSNFELTLSQDGTRVGIHKCSNLLDFSEVETKHSFNSNLTKNTNVVGEMEPYQYSAEMRSDPTLRFYQNLDLEACLWTFESYYSMSELVSECGGKISTDSHAYSLVQSSVLVDVPLHISYIFHVGGLQHYDLRSHLRLIFVYDSAILWQQGISPPKDSHHGGHLFPTSMKLANDGRLVVNFRTEARFHGCFVLSHSKTSTSSTVVSKEQPDLTCTLHLVKSEPTFAEPEQEWEFTSDVAVRDYSGTYTVMLIPCVAWDDTVYSSSVSCNPQEPVAFNLEVRFQQVSDPVPSQFSLDTHFFLTKQRALWLYNGSTEYQEIWDTSFQQGDKVYGRIMVDPVQNLGDSFHLSIEKCFLCTGVDGYIPKYNPHENEFGCIADSPNLLYSFKIIDRISPSSVVFDLRNIPFNAELVRDDQQLNVKSLLDWPGSDGFSFSPDPLFQASQGRQWFIHCMFTVKSQYRMARHFRKRSIATQPGSFQLALDYKSRVARDTADIQGVGQDGRGTNLHRIELQLFGEKTSSYTDIQKPNTTSKFHMWWLSVTSSVFAAILLVITVWVVVCRHNNRRTSKQEATTSERLRTLDTTVCGTSHNRSSMQNFTSYCAIPSKDSTEV